MAEVILIPDTDTAELLRLFSGKKVLVLGDLVLDHYLEGSVDRISPEAPVPVVSLGDNSERWIPGGAANVALNVLSLGGEPYLAGVTGKDMDGKILKKLLDERGVDTSAVIEDPARPTTVKTRVTGRNHQLIRIDREKTDPIPEDVSSRLLDSVEGLLENMDSLVIEDYNKGVLTKAVIRRIMEQSRDRGLPVSVDPKLLNFWEYHGSSLFKPNRHEAGAALGKVINSREDAVTAAETIMMRMGSAAVLLTLGSSGAILADSRSNTTRHIPAVAKHVFDVSGAGDSVIAVMGLAACCSMDIYDAAMLAGLAAAAVCAEPGVYAVSPADVIREAGRFGQ